jgi:hypothetical protein
MVDEVHFMVATGCMGGAGTDSGVWFGFGGSLTYTIDSPAGDLERGTLETFKFVPNEENKAHFAQVPERDDPVLHIYFTRAGSDPPWYLDYVAFGRRTGDDILWTVYMVQRWISSTTAKPNPWIQLGAFDFVHELRDCEGRTLLFPDGSSKPLDDHPPLPSSDDTDYGPVLLIPPEPIMFRGHPFRPSAAKR